MLIFFMVLIIFFMVLIILNPLARRKSPTRFCLTDLSAADPGERSRPQRGCLFHCG
jgi:hypothetical protein